MKVTFVANFMNHHQLPFGNEMQQLTDDEFTFVAFEPLPLEQNRLGYEDMNALPFIIRTYEGESEYKRALEKILNDDMVIFGSCPNSVVAEREATGKPFVIYSERFFKKGTYRRFIPITYKKIYNRLLRYEKSNVSVLCSSAYLPYDLKLLGKKFKTYKWGYFPEAKKYDNIEKVIDQKPPSSILWVARFIKLKHPEAIIETAKRLKAKGYDFKLTLVGRGELEVKMRTLVSNYGLGDNVVFAGSMSPGNVRTYMEKSSIFVFTSDQHEGWGAVINEAMNSGCAVVASHAVGSVPFLVQHGKNGLVYRNGDLDDLYKKVKYLCDNQGECKRMGNEAYKTMTEMWCAENATERLYKVFKAQVNDEPEPVYPDGPVSIAEVIKPIYKEEKYDKI
ncbi:MAG: glycosyltransferase [Clostridiales bacterium]|nr:glycosyltransferase [Clostridiales bacterium]